VAGAVGHEAVVKKADLHEVLANGPRLDVIIVRLRDPTQEVHGVGVAQVVAERRQDEALGTEDLGLGKAIIGNMAEVGDVGSENLLVLGGNQHGGDADELQAIQLHHLLRQEAVDDVDGEEQRLGEEVELGVDLDQPVDEDAPRLPLQIVLVRHVLRVGNHVALEVPEILENVIGVLGDHERVVEVLAVQVLDTLGVLELVRLGIGNGGLGSGIFLRDLLLGDGLLRLQAVNLLAERLLPLGQGLALKRRRRGRRNLALLDGTTDGTGTRLLGLELLVALLGSQGSAGLCTRGILLDTRGARRLGDQADLASRLLPIVGLHLGHVADIAEGGTFPLTGLGIGGKSRLLGLQRLRREGQFVGVERGSLGSRDTRRVTVLVVLVGDETLSLRLSLEVGSAYGARRAIWAAPPVLGTTKATVTYNRHLAGHEGGRPKKRGRAGI